ncbi:MAG: ABC transporter substrate-binding protein [Firmicutes bacterium]|nr:ABC transporter substrate-binding protein [Bacillota bacterium]
MKNLFVKRTLCIMLSVLMAVCAFTLTACGEQSIKAQKENDSPAGTILQETEDSLTIVDQAGREVTVGKDIESIALCYRVVIRFLLSLDQGDKITGIGKTEDFLEELQPSLKECADVGKGVADIEALAELKPDLFFHKASDVETLEAVEEIGIPAVGIEIETPEDMLTALDLMGKVCGAEEKADALRKYYNDRLGSIAEMTSVIDNKKSAVIMGSSIGKVADGTMLQGEMIERAGGINCAAELEATELWPSAGAEQIFAWNPEYIFITNSESASYTVDDILKDPAWSEIEAVKNRHVYVMPAEKDSWEFPGIVSVLGIEYMIRVMYPQLLSDDEFEADVDELYELSYGRTFDRSELGY